MSQQIYPVILCGGSGTRLWPASRRSYPKQLLSLVSDRSLLQETILRFSDSGRFARPVAIAGEPYRFAIADQFLHAGMEASALILEPEGRNTAPAAAIAANWVAQRDLDAIVLLTPSDHLVGNQKALLAGIETGAKIAQETGALVTFGVTPTGPETGYGYIKTGDQIEAAGTEAFWINKFTEKPDLGTAKEYLAEGGYLWNSGLFLFRAKDYLDALERLEPEIAEASGEALAGARDDLDFLRLDEAAFKRCRSISIDYAVMERIDAAAVVPVDMDWSDVGTWPAVHAVSDKDDEGNSLSGPVLPIKTHGSQVRSDGPLVVTYGVDNLAVIASTDAILVSTLESARDLKEAVEQLDKKLPSVTDEKPRTFRPWGWFETVDEGPGFKVKRIAVKPGRKLSLQTHAKRAEHWVVVTGEALITTGDKTMLLKENQSTYIPVGTPHRLENPGEEDLHIVEVQSGSYLGEDDIVRLDDVYGRQ